MVVEKKGNVKARKENPFLKGYGRCRRRHDTRKCCFYLLKKRVANF